MIFMRKMTFEEVLDGIEELSYSQGFYGRLLERISELDDIQLEMLRNSWHNAFEDMIEFILWIER